MVKLSKYKRAKKTPLFLKVLLLVLLLAFITTGMLTMNTFKKIYQPNVVLEDGNSALLFIPSGSQIEDVVNILYEKNLILDRGSFEWLAEKKNYRNHVKPGRYRLADGMSNNELINMLRAGNQEAVRLTFHNIRFHEELAGIIGKQLEIDSVQAKQLLSDNAFLKNFGYEHRTVLALFIPNTYEVFWNITPEVFFQRMESENRRFWNKGRESKLKETGLTKLEASILASIIEEETFRKDEMPAIAGVYMNRLKRGMRLQADPTIKFAIGNMNVNRVLKKDLQVDSPYNTYKYAGLPPGPIRMPSIQAIDAVLNYQKHQYIFFCAKEDFSGYHRFARTLQEHNRNARLYQEALNKRRILR